MAWLADNWDAVVTIFNSIGFLLLSSRKANK